MKVLLINPPPISTGVFVKEGRCQTRAGPEVWPPVTLGIIASLLDKNDFDVDFLDATALGMTIEKIKMHVQKGNFDAAIINSTTATFYDDIKTAEIIKETNNDIINIIYGTHVTALPEEALSNNAIDYVIRNEPEFTALYLLLNIRQGKSAKDIKGVSFKYNGNIVHNERANLDYNLDNLPIPMLELFPMDKYKLPNNNQKFTILRSSRGCPFQCTYCTSRLYYGCKWRTRSAKNILDEIEFSINRHNINNFFINSDTFNFNKKFVKDLCQGIRDRKLDIKWICNSRVDTINKEMAIDMKNAGCWLVSFGTESGSQKILDNIKKGITLAQSEKAIAFTKEVGLDVITYFMFGLPGETKETMKQTIKFAKKLDPTYARFYKAVPYPGTEFCDWLKGQGRIKSYDWSKYDQANCDVYDLEDLTSKEAIEMVRKAYLSFYLRPSFITKQLFSKNNGSKIDLIKNGLVFLKDWVK